MKIKLTKFYKSLLISIIMLLISMAITIDIHPIHAASFVQKDLFFGLNISSDQEVSETEFAAFVDNVITPQFPAGLTIFDADIQFVNSKDRVVKERSKLLTIFIEDTPKSQNAVNKIVMAYLQKFQQESIWQVTNADDLKVGFGIGENLIDNDPIPEFIAANLLFGRNIPGGGEVSEAEFQNFVDHVITPRFPSGLTITNANGQFRDHQGKIIEEQSKQVTLFFADTQTNETAIDEIIAAYIKKFHQESVLLAVNEDIAVAFNVGANVIDNDPVPELIMTDLFFGRNIPGKSEVSETQFQAFVDSVITPRFASGFTIFNTDGQFQDSTGAIIKEQSKVIRFLLKDTQANETAIDEIMAAYLQQFNQESVLLVVDEDAKVSFDT